MGRNAQPAALLRLKGKSHRGQKYFDEREAREVKAPFDEVKPPEYLTGEKDRAESMEIAGKLKACGIFTELDEDVLARYILSRNLYLVYTAKLMKVIKRGSIEDMQKLQRLQSQAFKQCQDTCSSLGMSITSRCKIQVPQVDNEEDYEL